MKAFLTIALLLLIGAAGFYYLGHQKDLSGQNPSSKDTQTLPLPKVEESPPILHPVPEIYTDNAPEAKNSELEDSATELTPPASEAELDASPSGTTLPNLDNSDAAVKNALSLSLNPQYFEKLFYLDKIISRFVVTVDNLPNAKLPNKVRLTQPPPGKFMVQKFSDGSMLIDPSNNQRYDLFAQLLDAVDAKKLVDIYIHFYPLIQEAYDSLGYKNRYFNDRLIEVIDHLLQTPDVKTPLRLVQPKVFYQFSDPTLEALSAGQKILLRIGAQNSVLAKKKLLELRKALIAPRSNDE